MWRNIDTAEEMRDAWRTMRDHHRARATAGFVVQKIAQAGRARGHRRHGGPVFGPVVSFGIAGPLTELLGDRSYRIPPMTAQDAEMVREIKASPILFGYRGSEMVDVEEIERLLLRVAQLQERPAAGARPRADPGARRRRGATVRRHRSGSSRSPTPVRLVRASAHAPQAGDTLHG